MYGDSIQAADIKRFRSMMLLDRAQAGDIDAAGELLKEAAAEYGRIGMPRHVAMVEEMRTTS